jgi:hypothetical protein
MFKMTGYLALRDSGHNRKIAGRVCSFFERGNDLPPYRVIPGRESDRFFAVFFHHDPWKACRKKLFDLSFRLAWSLGL